MVIREKYFTIKSKAPSVLWDTTLDSGKEELNSVTKSAGVANISECSQYTQTNMLKILTYIRKNLDGEHRLQSPVCRAVMMEL